MFTKFKLVRPRMVLLAIAIILGVAGQARGDNFQNFPDDRRDAIAAAIAMVPDDAGEVYDQFGDTGSIEVWNFQEQVYIGPFDVTSTLDRIRLGYWIRTSTMHDGGIFNLRVGQLPNVPRRGPNYYREFFVWPAMDLDAGTYDRDAVLFESMSFPGSMRILMGQQGEVYFTGDHYGQESPPPGLPGYFVNPTGPGAGPESAGLTVLVTPGP
jgi:hypothetical protein